MKDKVAELRELIAKKRAASAIKPGAIPAPSATPEPPPAETASTTPADTDGWQTKYEEARKAGEMQKDLYLRLAAEFENFRKRIRKEQDENSKYATEKVLKDVIPVLDNLEATLAHAETAPANGAAALLEGVQLTLKQFLTILAQNGMNQIAGVGQPYDHNTQEAIGTEAVPDVPAGQVIHVHRKGYILNGRLLRAAMVTVSK